MPAVLESFGDQEQRKMEASIRVLEIISHWAPKQLAEAADTQPKVRGGAERALGEVRAVVRHPEVCLP